ncbi:MAG: DNA polymerase, partial [Candidatus Dojkabacteria bacterium]|nr:DNA polymerase [Candidatus Dojkabacteria bacterium]
LEVDIEPPYGFIKEYGVDAHDWFNGYPLFPEKIDKKLECTLYPKKKYLVHIAYLQLGLKLGYRITKIHSIIQFLQKPIMKKYIEFNTERRKNAPNKFYEDFYKLMNNSIYGKTCENPLKYKNRKIITRVDEVVKFLNSTKALDFHKIDDGIILGEYKNKVMYRKPVAIGFTVLEISKMLMADFYYNVMKKFYGMNCKLLYTDTDSLVCHIKAKNPAEDFKTKLRRYFEQPETVKVPGLMKVECWCVFFGAYSPKNYIYVKDNLEIVFRKKGVPSNVVNLEKWEGIKSKGPKFIAESLEKLENSFVDRIEKNEEFSFNRIASKNHEIFVKQERKCLNNIDTKRKKVDKQHTNAKGYKE